MKKIFLFGLQFFILFILLFLLIISGIAITYVGSNWTPGSSSIFTVVFANLPDILMRSMLPAMVFAIFITYFRNITKTTISFGQIGIIFLLAYLITAFGLIGLREFSKNRTPEESHFKAGLISETIHPVTGGYIYVDRKKDDIFHTIILYNNGETNSTGDSALMYKESEYSHNLEIDPLNPYFGPLFIPSEPVLQWLVDDIKIINDTLFMLYDTSILHYFIHVLGLILFCGACVICIKATKWTLVNILLILFLLRGILFLYPVLLEVQKIMTGNFPQMAFLFPFLPAIVLGVFSIILIVTNIIISAPKPEAPPQGDIDFEEPA